MRWHGFGWRAGAGLLFSGVLAFAAPTTTPVPGTLNYLEGQASVNGQALNSQSIGNQVLQLGEILDTQNGKLEMLLTPGVFLRLGENSEARLVSAGLADTEIALLRGQATIEADYWSKDNRLKIDENGAAVELHKKGLYVINSGQPFVQVLDGKAEVLAGDQHVSAGKDREAYIDRSGKLKTRDFDSKLIQEASLVRWSRLRSEAEARASFDAARTIVLNEGGYGWYGPGWYWAGPYGYWSYLPADGILYSPFGWGFYSPGFVYYGGFYGGFRGGVHGFYPGRAGFGGFHGGGFARGGFAGGMHGGFGGGGRR